MAIEVEGVRNACERDRRDPDELEIQLLQNLSPSTTTLEEDDRPLLHGSPDQIASDLLAFGRVGVEHLIATPMMVSPEGDTAVGAGAEQHAVRLGRDFAGVRLSAANPGRRLRSDNMKFGIPIGNFGTAGKFGDINDVIDIAERAELLGFDSVWVHDHIFMPATIKSRYPYNDSGVRVCLPPGPHGPAGRDVGDRGADL